MFLQFLFSFLFYKLLSVSLHFRYSTSASSLTRAAVSASFFFSSLADLSSFSFSSSAVAGFASALLLVVSLAGSGGTGGCL